MGYFSNIQNVLYDFTLRTDQTQVRRNLPDMTTRVSLFASDQDLDELTDDYRIEDGDTPDVLSYRLYESTEFYWTILFINQIENLQEQWPLNEEQFQAYLEEKYPGVAQDVNSKFIKEGYTSIDQNGNSFIVMDEDVDDSFVGMYVVDRVFNMNPDGFTFGKTSIREGTRIVSVEPLSKRLYLDTSLNYVQGGPVDINTVAYFDIIFRDAVPEYFGLKDTRTTDNHIVDDNIYAYYPVPENTNLVRYTVFDYETELNEKKRIIKVVKPSLIASFVDLFNRSYVR